MHVLICGTSWAFVTDLHHWHQMHQIKMNYILCWHSFKCETVSYQVTSLTSGQSRKNCNSKPGSTSPQWLISLPRWIAHAVTHFNILQFYLKPVQRSLTSVPKMAIVDQGSTGNWHGTLSSHMFIHWNIKWIYAHHPCFEVRWRHPGQHSTCLQASLQVQGHW